MTTKPTDPEKEKMTREDYLWDASGTPILKSSASNRSSPIFAKPTAI